jgi:hypothetical protein
MTPVPAVGVVVEYKRVLGMSIIKTNLVREAHCIQHCHAALGELPPRPEGLDQPHEIDRIIYALTACARCESVYFFV